MAHDDDDEAGMSLTVPGKPSSSGGGAADDEPAFTRAAALLSVEVALGYSLAYFWRYPIFILPDDILRAPVVAVAGRRLDLRACFSLAFILGFGAGKPPAMRFMASRFFFRHRRRMLLFLWVFEMLVECLGVALLGARPGAQVACVFVSSFFASWNFGGVLTCAEARAGRGVLRGSRHDAGSAVR